MFYTDYCRTQEISHSVQTLSAPTHSQAKDTTVKTLMYINKFTFIHTCYKQIITAA